MMKLETMYTKYFQKSKVFLYPALGIRRGFSVTPITTYACWEGIYTTDDMKLCILYHLRDDEEFKNFEKSMLLGNKLYHDFKQVENSKGVYIFDFTELEDDWKNFIAGKYSKFSDDLKKKILSWIGKRSSNFAHVESFIYPNKYFGIYSELIGVREELLRDVGELCDRPDFDKESLKINVISLEGMKKI